MGADGVSWAREYFERGYAQRWGLPPVTERIRQEADGVWALCQLTPGAHVVDLGCGHGRHALALAARGAIVVGVDASVALLDEARRLTGEMRFSARWVRADLRRVPFQSGTVDAVVSIDAFGFFELEDENQQVLREAARVLRPGGGLALKVVNGSPILADFRRAERQDRDGVVVTVERTLSLAPARMVERLVVSGPRGSGRYERRQRLYGADEMTAAARDAGFTITGLFADAAGAAFESATSPAIWLIARR